MSGATSHYSWVLPAVGGDGSAWGGYLNSNLIDIDAKVYTNQQTISAVTAQMTANAIILNKATVGVGCPITGQSAGLNRWVMQLGNGTTEGGSNAGSDFTIQRYADSGSLMDAPLTITRTNGAVAMTGSLSVAGNDTVTGNSTIGGTLGVTGTATFSGTLNAQALHSNTTLTIAGATTLSSTLGVTGATTLSSTLSVSGLTTLAGGVNGATSFNSNVAVAGQVSGGTGVFSGQLNGSTASFSGAITVNQLGLPAGGYITAPTGASLQADTGGNWAMIPGSGGNFLLQAGNGYKSGGGSWATLSDERIKTVVGEYRSGLDEVLQLRPVTYVYKGNDGLTADGPSPNEQAAQAQREFVGFVAQDLEAIFPGMVSRREGFIDGQRVTDMRDVDTSSLVFALVNSCKELASRVQTLEAALKERG